MLARTWVIFMLLLFHPFESASRRSSSRSFLSPSSTSLVPRLSEGPPRQSYILPFFLPFVLPPVRSSSRSFLSPSSTSLVPRLSEGPPRQSYILPFFLPFILPPVHSYPPPGLGHAEVPTVPPWCLFNVEKTAEGERKHSHYALH